MRAPRRTRDFAKELRRKMSLPEVLLWQELKKSAGGIVQFRKQHPFGPYVLDFYCARARLCVEVDGYAHGTENRPERDVRRDRFLGDAGIHVERISASAVLQDAYAVAYGLQVLATARMSAGPEGPLSQLR